jgi:hypothetical protein
MRYETISFSLPYLRAKGRHAATVTLKPQSAERCKWAF